MSADGIHAIDGRFPAVAQTSSGFGKHTGPPCGGWGAVVGVFAVLREVTVPCCVLMLRVADRHT